MLVMDNSTFTTMKMRWGVIEKRHLDELDPGLVVTLQLLNRHPDIVTIFSCQGHEEKEEWPDIYLLCGIRNMQVAMRYYELLKKEMTEEMIIGLDMTFCTRQSILTYPEFNHYPAVSFNYNQAKGNEEILLAFQRAAATLVDPM